MVQHLQLDMQRVLDEDWFVVVLVLRIANASVVTKHLMLGIPGTQINLEIYIHSTLRTEY